MRIIIAGAGSIGSRHVRNLLNLGYKDITVCDPVIRQELGVRTAPDFLEELKKGYDAAFICTPTSMHVSHALAALENGCHVFLEKPISNSMDNVEKLLETDKKVMVGLNLRFHPVVKKIKEMLTEIGEVLSVRSSFAYHLATARKGRDYKKTYAANKKLGGGILFDSLHDPDFITWMLGEPKSVFCAAGSKGSYEMDVENVADILVEYETAVANIHLDYTTHVYTRHLQIIGNKATLYWEFNEGKLHMYDPEHSVVLDCSNYDFNETYIDELNEFFSAIKEDRHPAPNISDAMISFRLMLAAAQSAQTGKLVRLK